jgi:hypothetical protein
MLANKITRIPVPALIAVESDTRTVDEPPSGTEIKRIVAALTKWLVSGAYRSQRLVRSSGFQFHIAGQSDTPRAALVPLFPHTQADSQHVWDTVNTKTSKYRRLVEERDLPFVVVLSAERGAGLDRNLVEAALRGQNQLSLSFTFGTFGEMPMRPTQLRQTDAPPVFDPCLSAVGWIETPGAPEARLTLWPIPTANRPIHGPGSAQITIESLD